MDGYTLSISRCSGGDGVEESFKAKIKRREAALDAFAVAEAYCKESWIREGALFAMHNMQDVWSFPLISCFPACWYASLLYL